MNCTYEYLLYIADKLIQKGCLNEKQLISIIDIVDIKKLVKNNKLSKEFIDKYLIPRLNENNYDDITILDIYKYQTYL